MAEDAHDATVRLRRPIAFLYPPQPLEPCPMPGDLLAHLPRLAELHAKILSGLGWDSPATRERALTWPLQPQSAEQVRGAHVGVVAFSWTVTQILAETGVLPDVVFGHSLGLHTALAVSGATRILDALEVVDRTAQFLAESHDEVSGAMLAVTGFTPNEIAEFCERIEPHGTIFPAIINSRRQVVVSGQAESVERLTQQLRDRQAWGLTPIPGHLPLHTPLMAPLADRCTSLTNGMRCHVPHLCLLHPTSGEEVHTVSSVELLWRTHLLGMIDFVCALKEMERLEISTYVEIGAGETLTRLCRWYRRDLPVFNVSKPELLERILHAHVE